MLSLRQIVVLILVCFCCSCASRVPFKVKAPSARFKVKAPSIPFKVKASSALSKVKEWFTPELHPPKFTKKQWELVLADVVLAVADYFATFRNLRRDGRRKLVYYDPETGTAVWYTERWEEMNPLMGKHPSREKFICISAGAHLLGYILARHFPRIREPILGVAIGIDGASIVINLRNYKKYAK